MRAICRFWNIFLIILVLTLTGHEDAVQAEEPIKIGGIFALSGFGEDIGKAQANSFSMAISHINERGGVNGVKIEYIIEDSEGKPGKAVMAFRKLVENNKVSAIVGPSLVRTAIPLVAVANQSKVPFVSCAPVYDVRPGIDPWVFQTSHSNPEAVGSILYFMRDNKFNKVGLLTSLDPFGITARDSFQQLATQYGITFVFDETYPPDQKDMAPLLARVKRSQPNAIINWSLGQSQVFVSKSWQNLSLTNIQLFQGLAFGIPRILELSGAAAENVIYPSSKVAIAGTLPKDDPQKIEISDYVNQYRRQFDEAATSFGGYAFDAVNLITEAIKAQGSQPDDIRKGLETIEGYIGVSGIFNYSSVNHFGLGIDSIAIVQIQEGEAKFKSSAKKCPSGQIRCPDGICRKQCD